MTGSRPLWGTSIALVLTLFMAGAACNGSTINGMGTGGPSRGGLGPGSPCSMSAQCASGDCGAGSCCTTACSTGDAVCGALGCDDAGACVYPSAGTSCQGTSCSGSLLSQKTCDGVGNCLPEKTGTACPGNYACGIDGSCGNSCSSSTYCASGFVCNAGDCIEPIGLGSCTENDDCTSAICGASGTGNCCLESCVTSNATCGSTGCDEAGACVYPANTVVCGPGESCTGSTQTRSLCDGVGHCGSGTIGCAPFACGVDTCKTTCAVNADCATGDFCDASNATCCAGLASGATVTIDSVLGDDAIPCCGFGTAKPCRTFTHAMALVGAGPAAAPILRVTVNGAASGNWNPEGEIYPIELGWGAEVRAPGIFFRGASDAGAFDPKVAAIFELTADAGGAESASIVGTPTNPVGIGMDQQGNQMVADWAIWVGPGSTLYLANASINGNFDSDGSAIHASGTLILGQDRSGAVTGQVWIGTDAAALDQDGDIGIECYGCTLSDVPVNGSSAVVITGQRRYDIDAEGPASISLSSAPVFGVAPTSIGFDNCPSKADSNGILVYGPVTLSLDHATIQCIGGFGISADGYDGGTPSLTINDTTIQNTQLALDVYAGSAVVSGSTLRYNSNGVVQGANNVGLFGTIDLSGGAVGGRNTVACDSEVESQDFSPGVAVLNETSAALNASNVDWDTAGPDLFNCNFSLTSCGCQLPTCTDSPGADGMDAVDIVGVSIGTILTTGNQLSPLDCTVPPGN